METEALRLLAGDCRAILPMLEPESVQCCCTSPPYWGLRDYGTAQWEGGSLECDHRVDRTNDRKMLNGRGELTNSCLSWTKRDATPTSGNCAKCGARRIDSQLGLEATPEEYITKMVAVFREVWRVLRDDGTLWLNLGDSYAANGSRHSGRNDTDRETPGGRGGSFRGGDRIELNCNSGLKPKDLCGIPWRLAFALQADGWYLRSDIIWHKPNPMPESVTDRCTKAHEYIFLLTKQERYFYDSDAIREKNGNESSEEEYAEIKSRGTWQSGGITQYAGSLKTQSRLTTPNGRNKRSVWTIATQPYPDSHFATFPEEIPKLCILAGSKPGDTILDPFCGSGTVGKVALELGRRAVLIELNPAYVELARARTDVTPGFF